MKKLLVSITLMILMIGACSPQAQPTDVPEVIEEQATKVSEELTPAQQNAISTFAQSLGITPESIKLVSTEAVDWPNSCLGVTTEGVSCAEVVTPGFRVTLEGDGKTVEYHTDETGKVIVPATVALTWSREGGIAGFCDKLTIFRSGEVQGTNCNTSQVIQNRLTDLLSAEQIAVMNQWIAKYGKVSLDLSDPKGVADGMSVKLQLMGTGTEQITSPEVQQLLLQFVQDLNQQLMTQ